MGDVELLVDGDVYATCHADGTLEEKTGNRKQASRYI
jgi:hypothetical protein